MYPIFGVVAMSFASTALSMPAASVCQTRLAKQKPSPYRCGLNGTLASPSVFLTLDYDYTGCQNYCMADYRCSSFSASTSADTCTLYNQTVPAMGFKKSRTGSVLYYNRDCFHVCLDTFNLEAIGAPTLNGYDFGGVVPGNGTTVLFDSFNPGSTGAFAINSASQLVFDGDLIASIDPSSTSASQLIKFSEASYIASTNYTALSCSNDATATSGILLCSGSSAAGILDSLQTTNGSFPGLHIANSVVDVPITVRLVPGVGNTS